MFEELKESSELENRERGVGIGMRDERGEVRQGTALRFAYKSMNKEKTAKV